MYRTRVTHHMLDAQTACFIKLPQPGDNSLSRPSIGAIRFDERPIRMPLAVLVAETLSKKHTRKCYRPIRPGPEQRSSLQRVQTCRCQNSFFRHRRKTTYVNLPLKIFRKKPFWSVTGELRLGKLSPVMVPKRTSLSLIRFRKSHRRSPSVRRTGSFPAMTYVPALWEAQGRDW